MSSPITGPSLEVVLVARNDEHDAQGNPSTTDYTLRLALARGQSGSNTKTITEATERIRSLSGFSPFGSDETDEFATWNIGRETMLSSRSLREGCEDDFRGFAEKSDHTEGFMITTPVSDAFSGLSATLLEILRDDFTKSSVFTTAMISDAFAWKREDTEVCTRLNRLEVELTLTRIGAVSEQRSKKQRLLNLGFSFQHLEEMSSLLLPIQPARAWQDNEPWTKFLRQDIDRRAAYDQVLTTHLQSANTELREPDGLNQTVAQLNWRGDNKICHLVGATPLSPAEHLAGDTGQRKLKESMMDFSVLPFGSDEEAKNKPRMTSTPFAQYSIVRGYEFEETQELGPILERASLPLKEPLAQWVCLPPPYPILPSSLPIFRSLLPNGRPLIISAPLPMDPYSPAGLFGLPDPLFPTSDSYTVQPSSIPILTTLSTTPDAKYLLRHLVRETRELIRVRDGVLKQYEEGEYSLGREGTLEMVERLETLLSGLGGENEDEEDEDGGRDEDENWDDTEPKEEDWDMD
ncbi:BZ3500_MvSof-1268-A1-R1_Chr6-2g08428 [Microbotryum saponariae]|uniref:BZ3500_MvSof-1268-A1-R1_Chr6-2g08428 protein n=1 Tax=Microbotryum saponariae TaxID=289078 RepID=A0A2X0MEK0_9BASI|nr:BZ3500_MvSof-1268-A1-R1_Chr6-2g08428 [Microbotryum saponariae]SDA07705.1 BZ3501_MvSof-1269-A2-R1_Chr6-1g08142 [Microbotryum saponariae]